LLTRGLRYLDIAGYTEIDGWLSRQDAIALYDLASGLPRDHPVVVEIGSWQGKSSLVLAKAIQRKADPVLYCIDPFDASGDARSHADYHSREAELTRTLREVFEDNMRKHQVESVVRILPGYSHEFAPGFGEPIDLLFIDGNHEYQCVRRDFRDWSPLIKIGGFVALHDATKAGPSRVIAEEIVGSPLWTVTSRTRGLFVARRALG